MENIRTTVNNYHLAFFKTTAFSVVNFVLFPVAVLQLVLLVTTPDNVWDAIISQLTYGLLIIPLMLLVLGVNLWFISMRADLVFPTVVVALAALGASVSVAVFALLALLQGACASCTFGALMFAVFIASLSIIASLACLGATFAIYSFYRGLADPMLYQHAKNTAYATTYNDIY